MSAEPPKPAAPQSPVGQDASMEDILASIRRILAEDQAAPMPAATTPEPGGAPADDILDLTEQMLVPEQRAPDAAASRPSGSQAEIDALLAGAPQSSAPAPMSAAEIDAMFASSSAGATPAPQPEAGAAPSAVAGVEEGLIGTAAATATAASFAALRAARGQGEMPRQAAADIALGNGAVTLEQIVREELRPLLKAWLDANLPGLVERLVKAELERVARG